MLCNFVPTFQKFSVSKHPCLSFKFVGLIAHNKQPQISPLCASPYSLLRAIPAALPSPINACWVFLRFCALVPKSTEYYRDVNLILCVSVIHRTQTWATGSLTCVCGHSCACSFFFLLTPFLPRMCNLQDNSCSFDTASLHVDRHKCFKGRCEGAKQRYRELILNAQSTVVISGRQKGATSVNQDMPYQSTHAMLSETVGVCTRLNRFINSFLLQVRA